MLDKLTSTWAILLVLIGVLLIASFLPLGSSVNTPEAAPTENTTLDADVLNQSLYPSAALNNFTNSSRN
ncbi:hypothetical protein [Sneathiella glossodoripedis]|uniref:hypothetical protein n=1 Tax=Sneathiella glossodoripedis TaxID=418853 RepID=UPI000472DE17|nr:hypothetical protein [Sneathiella glossodoripedis]